MLMLPHSEHGKIITLHGKYSFKTPTSGGFLYLIKSLCLEIMLLLYIINLGANAEPAVLVLFLYFNFK